MLHISHWSKSRGAVWLHNDIFHTMTSSTMHGAETSCGVRQEPAPEVNKLRRGECWRASQLQIFAEEATPLEGVAGAALDIVCVLERCGAGRITFLPTQTLCSGCLRFALRTPSGADTQQHPTCGSLLPVLSLKKCSSGLHKGGCRRAHGEACPFRCGFRMTCPPEGVPTMSSVQVT